MSIIQAKEVKKWFGDFQALKGISMEVAEGEVLVICGPSGSGKSTFIRCINRLEQHQEGEIIVDGIELTNDLKNIEAIRSEVGMVFQSFNLFPHITVMQNITLAPIWVRKKSRSESEEKAMELLERMGIPEQANKYPGQLSGGQQQRVALARSLAKKAKILLLDEPLVNLDYKLREGLREEFKKLFNVSDESNSILIYASTDPLEAMQLNGDIIVIDEGKILQTGTAKDVFENPATAKVAEITNDPAMNINKCLIQDNSLIMNDSVQIQIPDELKSIPNGKYLVGIRATDIYLDDQGFAFDVEISEISGSETFLHLRNNNLKCVATIEEVKTYNTNQVVKINFDKSKIYLFEESGDLRHSPYQQ